MINKLLKKFGYKVIKDNEQYDWGQRIYRQAYIKAVLTNVDNEPLPEENSPLKFDEAPIQYYTYFVSCYMTGYRDGITAINNARDLLLTSYKP